MTMIALVLAWVFGYISGEVCFVLMLINALD